MSGKREKILRKMAKKELEEKLQNQQPMQQQPKPEYSLSQLENYIALHQHVTGALPKVLELSPGFYNWYIQEAQRHAETLNLKTGFKDDAVMFLGIKLEKKIQLVVPQSPSIATK